MDRTVCTVHGVPLVASRQARPSRRGESPPISDQGPRVQAISDVLRRYAFRIPSLEAPPTGATWQEQWGGTGGKHPDAELRAEVATLPRRLIALTRTRMAHTVCVP